MRNYSDIKYEVTGTDVYAAVSDLPLSGVDTGTQAFVSGTNRLYMWTGTGWYNIALINTNPSLSGVASSYSLSSEGANTVVTLSSTDPEGLPISFSVSHIGLGVGANAIATVTQSNNIFTFTPTTNTALAGTFATTFTASDGVNVAVANSSFTLAFVVNIENSNHTTALITSVGTNNQVNNTFVDSSTNSHTITASGDATQNTFSPYRHGGYSTYFDGSGDYLSIADNAAFNFGSGDSTIEMWVYPLGTGTFNLMTRGSSGYSGFILSSTGFLESTDGATWAVNITFSTAITANTWQHVAVVRNGSTITVYRNGTSVGTASISGSVTSAAQSLIIGQRAGQSDFFGYMSDVRMVKGTAVYTSAFTPPTERLTAITNTSLLACHLPYIADGSTNGHSITVNGNTKTEPYAPYDYETYSAADNGGSMYFDGSGDRLTFSHASDFTFGTGDLTIEFWIKTPTNAITGGYSRTICEIGQLHIYMRITAYHGGVDSAIRVYDETGDNDVGNVAISDDRWHHVVVVRESGTMKCWVDGKYNTGVSNTRNLSETGTNAIGGRTDGNGPMEGSLANLRVVKGTAIYTGTSNFTPPTAPLTAITNTSLLLNGTNAGIIDKSQSVQTLTLNGDVKSSTTQSKYLTSSMYFDGTGDYLNISSSEIHALGGGDYTVECWVYLNSSKNQGIWDTRTTNTSTTGVALYVTSGNEWRMVVNNSTFTVGGSITNSTWTHVAVVRSGSTITVYVAGSSVNTATSSINLTDESMLIATLRDNVDTSATFKLDGYMSDFRVTKGLARYTANFTPPTAALQG